MRRINLQAHFEDFIDNPGFNLNHPNKNQIFLDDIYIFPDIRDESKLVNNSSILLDIWSKEKAIMIVGSQDSGKTALVKALIRNYLKINKYPIYIDVNGKNIEDFKTFLNIVYSKFEQSYDADSYNYIKDQRKHEKILFIDNIDGLECSSNVLTDLWNNLENIFCHIVLSAKPHFDFTEINQNISTYEIMEFNAERTIDLIHKWHNISKDEDYDLQQIEHEINKSIEIIDTIREHNLVPSYPIFILTILQHDQQHEANQRANQGSYANYYEYIIKKSLSSFIDDDQDEKYIDLLSKLSFYMLENKKDFVGHEDLVNIHNQSLTNQIAIDLVLKELIKSNVLESFDLNYKFKNKYTYHYFAANYLSTNTNTDEYEGIIKDLCANINDDDSANILLFITHLSNDSFAIDEVKKRAKSVLSEIESISINNDLLELDDMIQELSKLGSKDKKLKEETVEYMSDLSQEAIRHKIRYAVNLIRILRQNI
ncbi:MAG: ATP-binding protein [Thermodesulfobacteriota bacterium]